MAIPKLPLPESTIPTFEELLKKAKQPKVNVSGPVGDELDPNRALELGFKIPPDWKLRQDTFGDSLISPRGNIFKDLKLSPEGTITDFGAFSAEGKPIKLPPPPSLKEPPPLEPVKPPPDTRPTQARIEAQIGRKLTFGEVLGSRPIPELGDRIFTQALSEELTKEEPVAPPEPLKGLEEPEPLAPPTIEPTESDLIKALPLLVRPSNVRVLAEYYATRPEDLRRNLITAGRNIDTETLVKKLYPDITEKGLRDYFSARRPGGVEGVPGTGLPPKNWLDKVRELADKPEQLVPFVASGVEIVNLSKLLATAKALEDGEEVSREDLQALKDYVERATMDTTWGFEVADVISQIIPFAGEFVATGGIFSAGKTATVKAGQAALKKIATRTGLRVLESRLAQFGVEAAGVVGGGTARTIPSGITRIPAATLEKQLVASLTGDEEAVWESALKSLGEQWVEVVSESTGGLFAPLGIAAKGALVKRGLFSAFLKANPGKSPANVRRIVERMGYNGVLGEMLEERVADVGHGVLFELGLGDQEFSIPSARQLSVEFVAFLAPAGALRLAEGLPGAVAEARLAPERGAIGGEEIIPEPTIGRVSPDTFEGQNIFEMTPEELANAVSQVKEADKNLSAEILGEELGARYDKLLKTAESSNIARADAAQAEIDKIEETLTNEQLDRLSGVGEGGANAEELADLADALNNVDIESEEVMGQSLRFIITKLPSHTNFAEMTGVEKEAVAVLRHANNLAKEQGFDTKRVTTIALEASARRFAPEDVEIMHRNVRRLLALKLEAPIPEEAVPEAVAPVAEAPKLVVTAPQKATRKVRAIQKSKEPESVPPEEAKFAHIELTTPDGPQPPKPPTAKKDSGDIFEEITDKGFNERPDQTLLRLHEAAIGNETRRTSLTIKEGGKKLKGQDIGVWRRDHLIPRPQDLEQLDDLYVALHNPSGVASGAVKVPEGFEEIYEELRALADWETVATLDFDPKAATIDDWFFRGWKPPGDMFAREGGRLAVKPKALRTPRVDATYQEMRDLGFEPLFWNPYEQWGYRHNLGVKYREQMELVKHLKGIGEDLIRPHDGGPIPVGWRVPEVGPAFEGKPFAMKDPDTGEAGVMYTRRWITEGKVANALENIYGKRPDLGKFVVRGRVIDPLSIVDALTFFPKRAKLFLSFFQQVDFLTRAGAGSWSQAVDALLAGKPVESAKALAKYPVTFAKVLQANFSPTTRQSLAKQLDSTQPIIQDRPGINLKGISEAGLSTRDVTIFPADMDKLVHEVANETGILAKGKRLVGLVGDVESAMRGGLFDGVYPAAIITDVQNNIAPMVARQHPTLNDAQINGMIARIANIKYSTIPASQSVFQNRVLRETLRRLFFSIGESEGLLRQATNALHGPNKRFWAKHWIGVYLFLITTASIIHFASTGEPLPPQRFTPITKDKWGPLPFGYNTEFASPTLPIKGRGEALLTLDLAGQMDTAFRILDPVNFITSRESVPVRATTNQISGTDFYGAPIDDVGPGGIVSRTSQLLHDLFAPIGVGGITSEAAREFLPAGEAIIPRGEDRLGFGGLAIQTTGVNIRTETTMNLLDRHAKESGFKKADGTPVKKWADLEPYQKNEVASDEELEAELGLRSEAAIERQQLKALGFSTLDEIDKERIVRGEALMSELYTEVEGLSGTELASKYSEFRNAAAELKREISIRKAQVDEDFQLFKKTGKIEKDPNKRATNEYYNTFDLAKKPSGVIDWDKQDKLEEALRRKWTPAQEAYADRNIGLTEWGPLFDVYEQQRRTLSESGFWDIEPEKKDQFLSDKPKIESNLLLWGYRTTPTSIEAARQLEIDAAKYGIPLESIQAFSKNDSGNERIPSERELWEEYFYYYDLPGTSYLNMTQGQVDAGKLPAEHRQEWETYNKLKTDKARSLFRKSHRKAAYSKWREDFRRANRAFNQWLISQEYNKPLPRKAVSRTARARTAPVGVFGSVSARPRRAAVTYPKFGKPRISTGITVRAPRAPGV